MPSTTPNISKLGVGLSTPTVNGKTVHSVAVFYTPDGPNGRTMPMFEAIVSAAEWRRLRQESWFDRDDRRCDIPFLIREAFDNRRMDGMRSEFERPFGDPHGNYSWLSGNSWRIRENVIEFAAMAAKLEADGGFPLAPQMAAWLRHAATSEAQLADTLADLGLKRGDLIEEAFEATDPVHGRAPQTDLERHIAQYRDEYAEYNITHIRDFRAAEAERRETPRLTTDFADLKALLEHARSMDEPFQDPNSDEVVFAREKPLQEAITKVVWGAKAAIAAHPELPEEARRGLLKMAFGFEHFRPVTRITSIAQTAREIAALPELGLEAGGPSPR